MLSIVSAVQQSAYSQPKIETTNSAKYGFQQAGAIATPSDNKLSTLEQPVALLAARFLSDLRNRHDHNFDSEYLELRVAYGYRTVAEQNVLYQQGRTTPGPIVTNAKGGSSFHNYKLAFDISLHPRKKGRYAFSYNKGKVVFVKPGGLLEEAPEYDLIGVIGKSYGLSWGGDWTSPRDRPHYQWRTLLSIKAALKKVKQIRSAQGDDAKFILANDTGWSFLDPSVKNDYFNHQQ
jgi:hypothetical protein